MPRRTVKRPVSHRVHAFSSFTPPETWWKVAKNPAAQLQFSALAAPTAAVKGPSRLPPETLQALQWNWPGASWYSPLGQPLHSFVYRPTLPNFPGGQLPIRNAPGHTNSGAELFEEAINTPFFPLQEKFHAFVLRGLRDIS